MNKLLFFLVPAVPALAHIKSSINQHNKLGQHFKVPMQLFQCPRNGEIVLSLFLSPAYCFETDLVALL